MENNKIKSRLLSYIVGLGMTISLSGCGDFSYSTNSNGDIVVEGTIEYESLLNGYKIIEVELVGKKDLYFAKKDYERNKTIVDIYVDVFTDKKICDEDSTNIISVHNLHDYLLAYEEVKDEYSIDDIERIYNKIKEDYYSEEKEKVKTLK
jgi:hypothetical protein